MTPAPKLLTAEEFYRLPDNGRRMELVRGRLVEMNVPAPWHGYICNKVGRLVGNFVEERGLGRVMNNDSGVVTEHDPDTVRGADICYYSYDRLPRGPLPEGYVDVVPELVFEVRSPGDRWPRILLKVAEYLDAGVSVVCVLDPSNETANLYYPDQPQRLLRADEELTIPELHGDFRVPVRRFFE